MKELSMARNHLVLEDGTVLEGEAFGYEKAETGEDVFTTAMGGYQESITDPSYQGQILIDKAETDKDADTLMELALDAGADDFNEEEENYEILTDPAQFPEVQKALEEAGVPLLSAEVTQLPQKPNEKSAVCCIGMCSFYQNGRSCRCLWRPAAGI